MESGLVCADVYAPVCGVDGKTYGNDCEAERDNVEIAHPGACGAVSKSGTMESGLMCADVYAPVCGVDGKTYGNDCEAERAHVEVDYPGECSRWFW
jgi:hypothetical protein